MAQVQDRRELILNAAAEMFARKGLRATTVRGIADAVGVLSGSLYHHFPSKDAIIDEVLTGYLDTIRSRYEVVVASGKPSAEMLHDLVVTSLEIVEEQPYATAIYQNESQYLLEHPTFRTIHESATDVQRTWLKVIEAGVADGSFRDDIPPRIFHRLIRDAVWLSIRWYRPDGSYSTQQLADYITTLFLQGYSADRAAGTAHAGRAAKQTGTSKRSARPAAKSARGRAKSV